MNILSIILIVILVVACGYLLVQTKDVKKKIKVYKVTILKGELKFVQSAIDGAKDTKLKSDLFNRSLKIKAQIDALSK